MTKCSFILVTAVLLVSTSADISENKNAWSSPVNKENSYENYKSPNNAYLPPLQQHTTSPANNIYPSYQNYYKVPVTNLPNQQYYNPGNIYSQQYNYGNSIPSNKYLPVAPQYNHYNSYNQHFNPQTISKPSAFLTVPYDMGIRRIGFMSNVLHNVHQYGAQINPGYGRQQNVPWGYGYGTQQNVPWGYGYGAQQNVPWQYGYGKQHNVPWGYGYGNRNWHNTPTYNNGVFGAYSNLRNTDNKWYYPNKGNVNGYNDQNRYGYSSWNSQNNAKW